MISCNKGLVFYIKDQNEGLIVTHCFLHIEALMSKTLGIGLKEVLDQVVKMIIFIKIRSLASWLFGQICINMDSQHRRLILHSDVRRLSSGNVLNRVNELKGELIVLFDEAKQLHFSDLLRCEF
ncbi:SCAN domain-containing protein 3 [Nosema granulosis]|uniref:SCAN domain-containing protein 3 n=1 Tax=Nosema granulosis TaxID=83296 RepID=A0A9P6GY78_9MICR|nr:SCAN domain-containing protein 3 [Nosema granulosis]